MAKLQLKMAKRDKPQWPRIDKLVVIPFQLDYRRRQPPAGESECASQRADVRLANERLWDHARDGAGGGRARIGPCPFMGVPWRRGPGGALNLTSGYSYQGL